MVNTNTVAVPQQLASGYFFSEKKVTLDTDRIKNCHDDLLLEPFTYEIAHYLNMSGWKPWENRKESLPKLFHHWAILHNKLVQLFEARDRQGAVQPMKQGLILFIQSVFWLDRRPVLLAEGRMNVAVLKWQPVNGVERLDFILQRPNHYHSFIQLTEMMKEIEKRFFVLQSIS